MPPTSCTSKWRIPSVRLEASRTTAKASCSRSSSASPFETRVLNSAVLARNCSSLSGAMPASSALIRATSCCMRLIRRVLRLPNILVSAFVIMNIRAPRTEACQRSGIMEEKRRDLKLRRRVLLPGLLQIAHGVHRNTIAHHLEMQMRPGGTAAAADQGNGLALLHAIADPDEHGAGVGIAGNQAGFMRDLDQQSVTGLLATVAHDAIAHGQYRRTQIRGNVHAFMVGLMAVERIGALSETGRNPSALDRPAGRRHGRAELAIQQQVFKRAQALLLTLDLPRQMIER